MDSSPLGAIPKFYGSVTVGERGQIVVPIEARKEFNIGQGDKLLVLAAPHGDFMILTKSESVTDFISKAMARLIQFEKILQTNNEAPTLTD